MAQQAHDYLDAIIQEHNIPEYQKRQHTVYDKDIDKLEPVFQTLLITS